MLTLEKYSLGVGDRFAHQAKAQLQACILAAEQGADVIPVWNKSNREHTHHRLRTGQRARRRRCRRQGARLEASPTTWMPTTSASKPWIASSRQSDFFTIDVADAIGKPAAAADVTGLRGPPSGTHRHGHHSAASTSRSPSRAQKSSAIADKYLLAVQEAGKIYRHIAKAKGAANFITEVSMDETDSPQTPPELLIILAAIADEKIPLQTIAPKFTGRFNKGVDYVGDVAQFEKEFNEDLAVIAFAIKKYGLPANLKLSVHSGSDKFSIYAPIRRALKKFDAGVHIKTAGTTWLEEVIGLAEAGGDGLEIAKEIYAKALDHVDELCAPYASVIDIDNAKLPDRRDGERLEFGAIRLRPAPRPEEPRLQPGLPPVAARRLQSRRQNGRPLPEDARSLRSERLAQRHREPLRAPHQTVSS